MPKCALLEGYRRLQKSEEENNARDIKALFRANMAHMQYINTFTDI